MTNLKFDIKLGNKAGCMEEEAACTAMRDIVYTVEHLLRQAIADKSTHFETVHPRQLIALIINNIMLNLFINTVPTDINPIDKRLKMARELVEEIGTIFLDCVEKIETVRDQSQGGKH